MTLAAPDPHRFQRGLTMVELMIAMAVALLLLAAVASLYFANKTAFRYQEVNSRLQENGRFALDIMAHDLRNASYTGCGTVSIHTNVVENSTASWWLDTRSMIRGYDSTTGYPADLVGVSTTSDALVVMYRDDESELMITSHDATNSRFTLGSTHPFEKGEILYATDCRRAAVFQMSGPASGPSVNVEHDAGPITTPGNCVTELGASCGASAVTYTFSAGGFVSRLISKAYFIAPSSSGSGNSLYVRSLAAQTGGQPATFEILPGVQAMKIRYGVDLDCDGVADRFALANEVNTMPKCSGDMASPWNMVVSAKLELLLLGQEQNVATDNQKFCLDYKAGSGNPNDCNATNYNFVYTASNRVAGKVFSTTVTLRNRVS